MGVISGHWWVVWLSVALSCLMGWIKLRHIALRITQARSARLWQLVRSKRPASMNNATLTLACAPMFGVLHPDDIRFALTRIEPLRFLEARKWAGNTIRLTADGSGYEDTREARWQWIRYTDLRGAFAKGSVFAFFALSFNSFFLWDEDVVLGVLSACNVVGVTVFSCALSTRFDYAARLLALTEYPELPKSSGDERSQVRVKTRRPGAKKKRVTKRARDTASLAGGEPLQEARG